MKKIMVFAVCLALCMAVGTPSPAVELSVDAVKAGKVPASYATVKDGKIVYGKSATAYSPDTMDKILGGYELALKPEAVNGLKYPSYAKVSEGKIDFGKNVAAYDPGTLHNILSAYGLILPLENAKALKDPANYVKVKDGKLEFGKSATAYSPEEFNMLLSAYILPPGTVVKPISKVEPKPEETRVEPVPPKPPKEPVPEPIKPEPVKPVPSKDKGCTDEDGDGVCDDKDKCPRTPKGAFVNEKGCWIIENLLFDFDKSVIKEKYYKDLDEVARVLKQNPDLAVEIQGHTCSVGTDKYNQGLSERRAKAVVEYLKNKGIDMKRLNWKGYGESKPAFPNKTKEGRIKNRRVELAPKP